jgi:hypothetical protein
MGMYCSTAVPGGLVLLLIGASHAAALWLSNFNTSHRIMSQNPNYGLQFVYTRQLDTMGYDGL